MHSFVDIEVRKMKGGGCSSNNTFPILPIHKQLFEIKIYITCKSFYFTYKLREGRWLAESPSFSLLTILSPIFISPIIAAAITTTATTTATTNTIPVAAATILAFNSVIISTIFATFEGICWKRRWTFEQCLTFQLDLSFETIVNDGKWYYMIKSNNNNENSCINSNCSLNYKRIMQQYNLRSSSSTSNSNINCKCKIWRMNELTNELTYLLCPLECSGPATTRRCFGRRSRGSRCHWFAKCLLHCSIYIPRYPLVHGQGSTLIFDLHYDILLASVDRNPSSILSSKLM